MLMISIRTIDRRRASGIIGLGAGGHARSVLDAIRTTRFQVVGLVDRNPGLRGASVLGYPVLGDEALLGEMRDHADAAFVGVGSLGDASPRRAAFACLAAHGYALPPIVARDAAVSPTARLGRGVQVLRGAIVDVEVDLGDNVIVNLGAVLAHDVRVAAHAHVAPAACLCGGVRVAEGAHVGAGAVVREGRVVGRGAVVGAGAVVVQDVPEGVIVVGVPAAPLRAVA